MNYTTTGEEIIVQWFSFGEPRSLASLSFKCSLKCLSPRLRLSLSATLSLFHSSYFLYISLSLYHSLCLSIG